MRAWAYLHVHRSATYSVWSCAFCQDMFVWRLARWGALAQRSESVLPGEVGVLAEEQRCAAARGRGGLAQGSAGFLGVAGRASLCTCLRCERRLQMGECAKVQNHTGSRWESAPEYRITLGASALWAVMLAG